VLLALVVNSELHQPGWIIQYWTRLRAGRLGFDSWQEQEIFLFVPASGQSLGSIQLPIQWVPGALSSGVKRPGLEAHNSPPSSVDVKKVWSYTSIPLYVFMAWCLFKYRIVSMTWFLVKHRDTFIYSHPHNVSLWSYL